MMGAQRKQQRGFTLIEILVAVFIFAILSVVMAEGLRRMLTFHDTTVVRAARLRELQFAFLMFSRDLEQAVDRSVLNESGQKEAAFIGMPTQMTFTHTGQASLLSGGTESQLQRVSYRASDSAFSRVSTSALDRAKKTPVVSRRLSNQMQEVRFQYYSRTNKRFYNDWPLKDETKQALPSGIRLSVTIPNMGKMSQFYVIPAGGS